MRCWMLWSPSDSHTLPHALHINEVEEEYTAMLDCVQADNLLRLPERAKDDWSARPRAQSGGVQEVQHLRQRLHICLREMCCEGRESPQAEQ